MESTKIYLRALEPDDYLTSYKWRNDHELIKGYSSIPRFVSNETERKWVLRVIEESETGISLYLSILLKETNSLIGYISLINIDNHNRDCYLTILIGNRDYLRKGCAEEASILLLNYAFKELGMNRVSANIISFNLASVNLFEKLGFIKEGIKRNAIFRSGKYHDLFLYGILNEDFRKTR